MMVKKQGLQVEWRPYIDENLLRAENPKNWRGNMSPGGNDNPAAIAKWDSSYTRLLTPYAIRAKALGVNDFSIGVELPTPITSSPGFLALPGRMRAILGKGTRITYSMNWGAQFTKKDLALATKKPNGLDYIGYDEFQDLKNLPAGEPTVSQLAASFQDVKQSVINFTNKVRIPVVYGELGVRAVQGGAIHPWDQGLNGPVDDALQANYFKAACEPGGIADLTRGIDVWAGGPFDTTENPATYKGYSPVVSPFTVDVIKNICFTPRK